MTLELTKELISRPSITPHDMGCQEIIAKRLKALGFKIESMRFGNVDNLWARYGDQAPLMVFAGHTDVVPHGPLDAWNTQPFEPIVRDGMLYGRGATDMKSGLAAMIVATENFIKQHPTFSGSIAFLITSDEEGPSIDGTKKVIEVLESRGEKINYSIVGEASSEKTLGDRVYIGRRGSLTGSLIIKGKQGHVAHPHLGINPIHRGLAALQELTEIQWDQGNESFPPTTFQISNIHAGTGASNVIPGKLELIFNFRYSTAVTVPELKERVMQILNKHQLDFTLDWATPSLPYLTKPGKLIETIKQTLKETVSQVPTLSTAGGTSDGRFIATTGAEVVELGPCNTSAHQINEFVSVADLDKLTQIYQRLLESIFS